MLFDYVSILGPWKHFQTRFQSGNAILATREAVQVRRSVDCRKSDVS